MKRLLLILLLAVCGTCSTNKTTGRRQLLVFSPGHMNKLGVEAYAQMTGPGSKAKVMTDRRFTDPLQRVGKALAAAANRPDYKWEFRVIDDKTVNAWALPGGKIAFYTGIYPVLQDEGGMAIVMGHEIMHAILQHGNERMSQGTVAQLGLEVANVSLKNNQYRGPILSALGAGAQYGLILPYSRKHESEADRYGLMLAARAGYDPEAAIGVWQRMAALSEGKRPPVLLSTHPDPLQRIENMKRWMPEAKRLYERARVKHRAIPLPTR